MPVTFAKDFELEELVIETVTGVEWDISLLLAELNVFEDLFNATVSTEFLIDDADNRINSFPITGHEWVRIKFRTPDKSYVKLRQRIYKISNREQERDRRQLYIINTVDPIQFINAQKLVSKAYKGLLISDIASSIQEEFLESSFQRLETTKNLFHFIPANWSPIRCMNWLAYRANSAVYKGSNYLYFQDVDGFNFTSLENLCDQNHRITYLYQPANIRDQEVQTGNKPRTLDVDEVAIQSFKFVTNFDTLENISYGMYGNKLLWHDIRKKEFGEEEFNYAESYNDYRHVEPNSVRGGLSRLWTTKSDFGSGLYQFASVGMPEQESHVKLWLKERTSQFQQLQNVKLHATVPGDSDRRVGDIVTVLLPSPEPPVEGQLVMDKYYMGRYLVTSVRHIIVKQEYNTVMELVKDSVFTAYP